MSKAKGEDKNHFWRLGTVDKETNKTGWTSSRMAKAVNIDSAERNYYVTMWQPQMPDSTRKQDDDDDVTVA